MCIRDRYRELKVIEVLKALQENKVQLVLKESAESVEPKENAVHLDPKEIRETVDLKVSPVFKETLDRLDLKVPREKMELIRIHRMSQHF